MDPLSVAASVISILQLSAKVLSYLNDVKDASKGRAQCAIEASNLHNLLTNLRFRLEEGHDHQPWFSAVQALAVENGPFDQFKQTLEVLQTKMTDGGRLKKIGEALVWKFKKDEVDNMLARMERLKTLVEIALSMDHFKLSQAIKNDVDSIRTNVTAIESAVDKIQHGQITESQRALLEWISPSDYPSLQSDIIKRRQEGTCQWFLDAPEVTQWLNEAKATLFCPGIPGAGKTMVAAIAVDRLLNSAQNGAYGVAYVYCNYKSRADQDPLSILAALLKQLAQSRLSALTPIEELQKKHVIRGTKPSFDDIYSALQDVVSQYPYVYLVVDALDECERETRSQLLPKLFNLQNKADIRLMVTSRIVPDVDDAFRSALRLEVVASDEDIKHFVAGQMHRLPRCVQRNIILQELVQERIVEAVGGMFLLARLHVESISNNTTAKEVKSTLGTLTKGAAALDHAYSEALERVEGQQSSYSKLAKNVLTWIVFTKRPLTTAEICCALAVEPGEAKLDPENIPDVDDVVSVCAGLVVVDQESAIIRLVHYTTQEYFERIREQWTPNAQLDITSVCLTYLCFDAFKSGSCFSSRGYKRRLRQNNLLDYAAKYWGMHATTVQPSVSKLASIFLWDSNLVASAVEAMSRTDTHGDRLLEKLTGLHLTAIFGLLNLSEMLLSQSDENAGIIDSKSRFRRTPLSFAAEKGHYAVVEMLLANDEVDPNSEDGSMLTPLSWAVFGAQEGIVKLLLMSKRVDPNQRDANGWTPLFHAVNNGHEAVVKALLASDTLDPNIESPDHEETPLSLAATKGHEAIVKLLLATNKVDANLSNLFGQTPLLWAADNGNETIVKLLLATDGVKLDSKDKDGQTPLLIAARYGHLAIVSLLLTRDVNLNLKDIGYRRTPLLWAAHNGHEAVVKLLLANDKVDLNVKDKNGRSSLYWATRRGHEAVFKLLLASDGVDPNIKDKKGRSSLHWAAYKGHETAVKLLLANDKADPNAKDKMGRSSLYWATKRGNEAVLKLLLASNRVDSA